MVLGFTFRAFFALSMGCSGKLQKNREEREGEVKWQKEL